MESGDRQKIEMSGYFIGVFVSVMLFLIFWHGFEADCQKKHDVYDCVFDHENAFTPAAKEPQ